MKQAVKENFDTQTNEIYNIIDQATTIKNDESNKVYNKCFLIVSIISILGLIAVPFNRKETLAIDEEENMGEKVIA